MASSNYSSISGIVKRLVYEDESRGVYLYEVFDSVWSEKVKVFVKNKLTLQSRVAFDGFLERNKYGLTLKNAQRVPVLLNSIYGMVQDKMIRIPEKEEKTIRAGLQTLIPKADQLEIEALLEALKSNKRSKEVYDNFHALSTCSWGELLLRGTLVDTLGMPPNVVNDSVVAYKRTPEMIDHTSYEDHLIALRKGVLLNPYAIAPLFGLPFSKLDGYLMDFNPGLEQSEERGVAAANYVIKALEASGSTIFDIDTISNAANRLVVPPPRITEHVLSYPEFTKTPEGFMLTSTFNMERNIQKYLKELNADKSARELVKNYSKSADKTGLSNEQSDAVENALHNNISVITGGPGCGKTFTLNSIISSMKYPNSDLVLLAPTGKAAQRMSEVTQRNALTIHSYALGGGNSKPGATIVVDEASMVSIETMDLLVNAMRDNGAGRLILIGDVNQLPSVGAGDILNAVISSNEIPVTSLTKIMRQRESSQIVQFAHGILQGKHTDEILNSMPTSSPDFFISACPSSGDPIQAIAKALDLKKFEQFHPNFNPIVDMQILSPIKKGPRGVYELNLKLKNLLNFGSSEGVACGSADMPYKVNVGDKILCTKNHYDHNLVNGDVGVVKDIVRGEIIADIAGKGELLIKKDILPYIDLGYAMTVHKAQGSEAPVVVTILPNMNAPMYERNLLYTAITRSKTMQWVIGSKETIDYCIDRTNAIQRHTYLGDVSMSDAPMLR